MVVTTQLTVEMQLDISFLEGNIINCIKNLQNMALYPAFLFLGINEKELIRAVEKVSYTRIFISVLFVKGKNGNECFTVCSWTTHL